MVSVIIPLMPIEPYATQVEETKACLDAQAEDCQVIVVEQPVEPFINKNKLLNRGFELAAGEFIWHCDADYLFGPELLVEMKGYLAATGKDVVFPMFPKKDKWKIADGGPFMRREVMERHGPLDETILGINWTTYPFIKWVMDNCKWAASTDLRIRLNKSDVQVKKCHRPSAARMQGVCAEVNRQLISRGYLRAEG